MFSIRKPLATSSLLLFVALSAAKSRAFAPVPPPDAPTVHGIAVGDMDPSIKPGNDFYHYADGAWIKRTEIPADRAGFGVFTMLDVLSSKRTASVIEDAAKGTAAPGSGERKIADMYHAFMDESGIESRSLAALHPHLEAIAAIKTQPELAFALGKTMRADVDALNNTNFHTANLFGLWVAPGFNDPDHYAPYLMEGGLQLPDREFYLGSSDRMKGIRTGYQAHVAKMLSLAGFSESDMRAARVVALEHAIAEKHLSLADNENIEHANNPWKRAEFATKAPGLDWNEYFRGAGLEAQGTFIVWQPGAFTGESALVPATPLDTWKDWLAYHLIESYAGAGALPKAFADERFNFFGKTLTGTTQMRPREQRGIAVVNGTLGDAVGKLYAKRFFSPEEKAQVQAMVANIMSSFRKRIDGLTWMNAATKAEAQAKLTTLNVGVGYPDTWRSYAGLEIKPDDYFGNIWRSSLFDYHYSVSRLGQAVDRKEWCMEPQTVNAVNLPLHNGLNFPAAILQPPFFDPKAPAAANYGAIGTIMGHEISHTFDSEGAAFDSKGRVRNWWTPTDLAHFNASTSALAAQYDTYKPFADINVNGKQTLGENIADVAGVAAALDGFHASLHGKAAPVEDGFSGDQQFFIAFAQNYRNVSREAALRQQVMTDPHSPSQYRATTVRNIDAWYDAFKVQPGETLYLAPDARVKIW